MVYAQICRWIIKFDPHLFSIIPTRISKHVIIIIIIIIRRYEGTHEYTVQHFMIQTHSDQTFSLLSANIPDSVLNLKL
jgi:hypothetical protein